MAFTTIDDPSAHFQIGLYSGNGNDGKEITLTFKKYIREEKKYESEEDLANQLMQDRYNCQLN